MASRGRRADAQHAGGLIFFWPARPTSGRMRCVSNGGFVVVQFHKSSSKESIVIQSRKKSRRPIALMLCCHAAPSRNCNRRPHSSSTNLRSSCRWRYAGDFTATMREMFVPIIQSRMKQARQCPGLRIKPGKIRAFVQIAVVTGEREVFRRVFSSMLARSDVFDVERQQLLFLPQPAILTTIPRALPDLLAQSGVINRPSQGCGGFGLKNPMSVLACT